MIKKEKGCQKRKENIRQGKLYCIISCFSALLCLINIWSKAHEQLTVYRKGQVFLRLKSSIKKKNGKIFHCFSYFCQCIFFTSDTNTKKQRHANIIIWVKSMGMWWTAKVASKCNENWYSSSAAFQLLPLQIVWVSCV